MSFVSRFRKSLIDKEPGEIYSTILKIAEDILRDLSIFKVKEGKAKILEEELKEAVIILTSLKDNKNCKSYQGKLEIQELHNIAVRSNRIVELLKTGDSHSESEYLQAISDLYNFIDRVRAFKIHIENLPYPNAGITVAGFVFSVIPFLNLLSIVFGGYLALSSDRRAQHNGILMIIITIIMIIIAILIQ